MTKQRKLGLALLIAVALSGGTWMTYSLTAGSAADKGYELWLSGDSDGALRYFTAQAETDPQAAYALAMIYITGDGVPENTLLGYEWLERAAKAGNKNALYNLGYYRYNALIPDTDQDKYGITSLKAAAQAGVAEAQVLLGSIYILDKNGNIPSDVEQARKYMTAAADQGMFFARFALGYIAYEFDKDYKKAVDILTPQLSERFVFPALLLADIYQKGGYGIEADPAQAKKFRLMAIPQIATLTEDDLMPKALSLYGAETADETRARLAKLEKLAENGNPHARYALYDTYMKGIGIPADKDKAFIALKPLIDKKDPKALYTWYTDTKLHPEFLTAAADAGYPDALYRLYQNHSNIRFDDAFGYDRKRAADYLKRAADTGHREAMIDIVQNIVTGYQFPDKETNAQVSAYLAVLLEKFPSDPAVLFLASERYGDPDGNIYDPVRSFELMKKAAELSPLPEYQSGLADKYAKGSGVGQDVKKAIGIYNSLLKNPHYQTLAYRRLVDIYYTYDTAGDINENDLIAFLKKDIEENDNYRQAYFYADYLLKTDPVKNRDQAIKLYVNASEYTLHSEAHLATMLMTINADGSTGGRPGDKAQALKLALNVAKHEQARALLTEKEWNNITQILFSEGKNNTLAQQFWALLALRDNNAEAQKLVEPLLGQDPAVSYYYAQLKLEAAADKPDMTDDILRPDIELMMKAADMGDPQAGEYVMNWLKNATRSGSQSNLNQAFLRISGLTERDILPRLIQCGEAGGVACMYELGEIYNEGGYGVKADLDKSIAWYEKIPDRDYRFTDSRLKRAKRDRETLADLNARVQKGDADAAYDLSYAWKNGKYGLTQDGEKARYYLTMAADGGNADAITTILGKYADEETLSAEDKARILALYEKLPASGSDYQWYKLGQEYLQGSRLVSAERQKARATFARAGSYGKDALSEMDTFDINLRMADESREAAYQAGYALLIGHGTQTDPLKALPYLQKAADAGHERATILLADTYSRGVYNKKAQRWIIEPDWNNAIPRLRAYKGPRDITDTIAFYEKTIVPAMAGDGGAMLAAGEETQQRGYNDTARYWFEKSAESGHPPAFCVLAKATENPDGKMAVLHRGAEKGDRCSDIMLAALQLRETPVAPDSPELAGIITRLENGLNNSDEKVSLAAFETLAQFYQGTLRDSRDNELYKADNKKYLALLESVADKRTDALIALYYYYRQNNDMANALSYLQKAHDKGDPEATNLLYKYYSSSEYCRSEGADTTKAGQYLTEWLNRSDYPESFDNSMLMPPETRTKEMGDNWMEGFCNQAPDPDKAIEWYTVSLKRHPTHALKAMYDAQVAKGNAQEAYYYGLLADVSSQGGETLVATLTEDERKAVEQRIKEKQEYEQYGRYAKEVEEKRLKAEGGDARTAFSLAVGYARGDRVPEDTEKMLYYYELAGKNGYARAYNILGNIYRKPNERGIAVNGKKALAYFDAGAKLGDSNTAHLAGDMLYFGQAGLEKNYPEAARYYEMTSLEQGNHHELAKYKVAWIYYNKLAGTGSDEDLRKARDNLILSAKYGNKDAENALKEWDFSRIDGKK